MTSLSEGAEPLHQPAKPERLYEVVAREIVQMISVNRGSSDWRLPSERELSEKLKVSRPVIREAVIALEVRGIVEVRQRQGIVVLAIPSTRLHAERIGDIGPGPFELLEARLAIESSAAALAADRITAEDLSRLESYIGDMQQENDVVLLNERGDRNFHMLIARATQNVAIVSMIESLWSQRDSSLMWKKLHEHIHAPSVRPLWIGDHHAILSALRLHNSEAAYKAMARHIRNVTNELLEAHGRGSITLDGAAVAGSGNGVLDKSGIPSLRESWA